MRTHTHTYIHTYIHTHFRHITGGLRCGSATYSKDYAIIPVCLWELIPPVKKKQRESMSIVPLCKIRTIMKMRMMPMLLIMTTMGINTTKEPQNTCRCASLYIIQYGYDTSMLY